MAYTNGYASDSVTTVAKQIAMNFECIRPRLLEVSAVSVLKPKQVSITMLEESDTADFDVSMTRYESDAFLKEEKSDTVALPNYVYIGVEILDDIPANFVLQVGFVLAQLLLFVRSLKPRTSMIAAHLN
ncbi:unnamed protein product [Clavelina lepadiformis]|uniref:Uncharacterized protein n=1 Tax=Clavelina lepadiformis TaxID=159417 RepID=A0ABP0H063_CLALP